MNDYTLKLTLLSDAAFGRGDGVAGLVDAEVQHDHLVALFSEGRRLRHVSERTC